MLLAALDAVDEDFDFANDTEGLTNICRSVRTNWPSVWIRHRHVCEKLAELHTQELIRLSAWNEQENWAKPFDEWPSANYFFA